MGTDDQPQDSVSPDDGVAREKQQDLENNVKSSATWMRLVFMIVTFALYALSRIVVIAVVVLQFLSVLFSGETNAKLQNFGQSLATYTYDIVLYLTFVSDETPFPFDRDWPDSPPS